MGRVAASVEVPGPLADVEALWYDPARWPAWVDGFGHVVEVGEAWPAAGSRALWDTPHGGRGRVVERVVSHAAGAGQECDVEDARLRGRRRLAFAPAPGGAVTVTVVLEYTLKADHALALGGGRPRGPPPGRRRAAPDARPVRPRAGRGCGVGAPGQPLGSRRCSSSRPRSSAPASWAARSRR